MATIAFQPKQKNGSGFFVAEEMGVDFFAPLLLIYYFMILVFFFGKK